jgi:VIT1/CCC1 family predicted Fe2+/Mn2+ transporter
VASDLSAGERPGPLDRTYPSDEEAGRLTATTNSRRSYAALWIVVALLLVTGAILAVLQNAIGGWGGALLGLGVVALLVLLFLNAFTGGPLFIRERRARD